MRGLQESYRFEDDKLVITRSADVGAALRACHELRAETPAFGKFRGNHVMHRVASISPIVALEWLQQGVNIFDPSPETSRAVNKRLNGEYKDWRTVEARL